MPTPNKTVVKAKKHLGQHFLKDQNIAQKIAQTLSYKGYNHVLEIGPGMGVLTQYLIGQNAHITALDIDTESIEYLNTTFLEHQKKNIKQSLSIIEADFLKTPPTNYFQEHPFAVIGNFPYNISTQILFKTLEYRHQIPEFGGMFQKEVAQRICEKPGSKAYGILSVLTQAFYDTHYLFTVPPSVFNPPPKVDSGVIFLKRKENNTLDCNEKLFFQIVKTAFNQRRKTLRNSLKSFQLSEKTKEDTIFAKRPEQLSYQQFIELTQKIEHNAISN